MTEVAAAARLVLAVTFLAAGLGKLARGSGFREALYLLGVVPPRAVPAIRRGLPVFELSLGVLLLTGYAQPLGPLLATVALVLFVAVIWRPATSGEAVPCGCFGTGRAVLDRGTLARNAVLVSYAFLAAAASDGLASRSLVRLEPFGAGSASWAAWIDVACLALLPYVVGGVVALWERATGLAETDPARPA